MNHNHIACWKNIQEGLGTEEQQVALIRASLLTPEQDKYLMENRLVIADLLNGRYTIDTEVFIHEIFYKPWNDILQANGLERCFSEEPIGQAMIDSIQKTLGMPIKFI